MAGWMFLTVVCFVSLTLVCDAKLAQPCDREACRLPDCRCSDDRSTPGGFPLKKTPQVVLVTLDDGMNDHIYDLITQALQNYTNPNKCPGTATLFISHNYTSYFDVERLYSLKHYEAADHSVTHKEPTGWWIQASLKNWTDEIAGEKEILHRFANIPMDQVRGFRAPFLAISENMFQALYDLKFLYDCSRPTFHYAHPPMWPYTYDYKSVQDCPVGKCPVNSYPGLWEIPNIDLLNSDGSVCGNMMDACIPSGNASEWLEMLTRNFHYHYDSNRAPFGMHMHAAWFMLRQDRLKVFQEFMNYLENLGDVWVLTAGQLIDWMRDPQDTEAAKEFKAWGCPPRPKPRCSQPNSCHYTVPGDFYMPTCTDCPKHFPSPTNPDGN